MILRSLLSPTLLLLLSERADAYHVAALAPQSSASPAAAAARACSSFMVMEATAEPGGRGSGKASTAPSHGYLGQRHNRGPRSPLADTWGS